MNEENIILENINLIHFVIKKMNLYYRTQDEYQEYYDDGMIGLIGGIRNFDENKGVKLSSFLYRCISNEILKGIRKKTTLKNKANDNTISLNMVTDENEHELYEIIPDEKADVEKETEHKIQLEAINETLKTLKGREALVFKMYYGLDGYKPKKQKEIAEKISISQSNVNRILKKATDKIKERVKNNERKIIVEEKQIIFKTEQTNDPLQEVNSILMEQLRRLKGLDLQDKENSKLEIARSNAISSTSKTIVQTIGIQLMVQKQQNDLLKIK